MQKELYFSYMKLRIQGNSIRLRLSKTDVETFKTNGYLEEKTDFGFRTFTYAINRLRDGEMSAAFDDGLMVIHIPEAKAHEWTDTDEVGIEYNQDVDGYGLSLHLVVEKDFKCIGKEGTDSEKDNFENPKTVC